MDRKRAEYRQCVALYFSSASTGRTDKEQALLRQVLVDVPRTSPGIPLFQAEFVQRVSGGGEEGGHVCRPFMCEG